MRSRANKKSPVVPIDEARRRLRQSKPTPAHTLNARPRWVVVVSSALLILFLVGVVSRMTLTYAGPSSYLMVIGLLGASILPAMLWLANRRDRRRGNSGEPPAISQRKGSARRHPPSRPSRPYA